MARRNITAALAVLVSLTSTVYAVPHLHPEWYPEAKPCHPKTITAAMIARYGSVHAAIIQPATGTKNIAVIIVRFPAASQPATSGTPGITNPGNFNTYITGMKNYYNEVSFGTFHLNMTFFGNTAAVGGDTDATTAGSFLMPNNMEYYGCGDVDPGCSGVGSTAPAGFGGAYLIRDAITAARAGPPARVAFSTATFDAVLVMHAGFGNETTNRNGDIWSAFYQEPSIIGAAGGGFVDGATFPELESTGITSPLGVMCHEFGHVLTLPDLYNTAVFGGASVVGKWDLMDAGPYLGSGTNPAHMGAWDKVYLGWATPQIASSHQSFSLIPIESGVTASSEVIKMPVSSGGPQEYFLMEYRSRTTGAYDQNIPGSGILIWHIDDAITTSRGFGATDASLQNRVNTGSPHYGVSIITADGVTISNANQGDAGNPYSNTQTFTSPKSDNFAGQPSGVGVVKIAGVGTASASFEVVNLTVTPNQTITKLINFPNPAGKGYAHPTGQGHTTIQFQVGRPATDYEINIYTLSGDLVRKVDKTEINLNTDRSLNLKWVYEFDWDLKNGEGQHVAPGVYLYLVRADGQTKSGKAVIIR